MWSEWRRLSTSGCTAIDGERRAAKGSSRPVEDGEGR